MSRLLELSDELAAFLALVEANGGEIGTDAQDSLDAWYERLSEDIDAKADAYGNLIRSLELEQKALDDEADRLTRRATAKHNAARRLKERFKLFLEQQGRRTLETARHRFTICANGGKEPVKVECDPADLAAEFQRHKVEADVDALREALKAGAVVFGARLGERGSHLKLT